MTLYPAYRLGFFSGTRCVILLKKPFTGNVRSATREGVELIMEMSGCMYHYYVAGIPVPVSRKYMVASITMNSLVKQFRKVFPAREPTNEIWMFYEGATPGNVVPVRYFILTEQDVKIR